MKACDIKQVPLSKATGISQGALSNYKNGRMPKVDELCKLADHFGVSVDSLLGRAPLPIPKPEPANSAPLSEDEVSAVALDLAEEKVLGSPPKPVVVLPSARTGGRVSGVSSNPDRRISPPKKAPK